MPLRLRFVRTSDGKMLQEALVSGFYAASGEDELLGFTHPSVGRFEVEAHKRGYLLKARGTGVEIDTYAMVDLGDVSLHCTVLRTRRDGTAPRGCCPRCETPLTTQMIGGAYRSIASERQLCSLCECQVLSLSNAAESLGAAADASGGWVRVVTNMSCPQCGSAMTPATLTVGFTVVGVDACASCQCVLLEPEDKRALEVAAEHLPR
jgi:hypothetical protein